MEPVEIETNRLISSFKEQFVEVPLIMRLLDNLHANIYSTYYLTEELRDRLRALRAYVKASQKRDLINPNQATELQAHIENAISNSTLTDSEYKKLSEFLLAKFPKKNDVSEFETISEYLFPFLESNYIKKVDKQISRLFEKINYVQTENTSSKVRDLIYKEENGKYIVQLFQILSMNWGRGGLSIGNIHRIVEQLQKDGLINTFGGSGTGKRDRLCFPSLAELDIREIRYNKENLIKGRITDNLSQLFRPYRARHLGVMLYDFTDDNNYNIYLIAKSTLPEKQVLTSIGWYLNEDIVSCMNQHFGYRPAGPKIKELEKDSLIAYVVSSRNKTIWQDKEYPRATDISKGSPEFYRQL